MSRMENLFIQRKCHFIKVECAIIQGKMSHKQIKIVLKPEIYLFNWFISCKNVIFLFGEIMERKLLDK